MMLIVVILADLLGQTAKDPPCVGNDLVHYITWTVENHYLFAGRQDQHRVRYRLDDIDVVCVHNAGFAVEFGYFYHRILSAS